MFLTTSLSLHTERVTYGGFKFWCASLSEFNIFNTMNWNKPGRKKNKRNDYLCLAPVFLCCSCGTVTWRNRNSRARQEQYWSLLFLRGRISIINCTACVPICNLIRSFVCLTHIYQKMNEDETNSRRMEKKKWKIKYWLGSRVFCVVISLKMRFPISCHFHFRLWLFHRCNFLVSLSPKFWFGFGWIVYKYSVFECNLH